MLGLLPLLTACGGSEETEEQTEDTQEAETCTYAYDENTTVLTWTAFKLSDKVGVDGTFNEINVTASESDDKYGVLSGATFEIPVNTLNSQDTTRDGKLKRSFFGNLESTEIITGSIVSIDNSGAEVSITMNGVTNNYEGEVKEDGEKITMTTTISILDFDGQTAMDSLSVVCAEKHTGPDGENKLWEDVNIAVSTTLSKTCE